MVGRDRGSWKVPQVQCYLWPDASGNDINGRGERHFRRPTMVYWPNRRDATNMPFKPLVDYFLANEAEKAPAVTAAFADWPQRAPRQLDDVAVERVADTRENWTAQVKSGGES